MDFKNIHELEDINYWILVKDFDSLSRFWKEDSEGIKRSRLGNPALYLLLKWKKSSWMTGDFPSKDSSHFAYLE